MSNKLIQALEPRLMLDGAAVATAIDAVDDLAQFQKTDNDKSSKMLDFSSVLLYNISDAHFTLMLIQHMQNTWKVAVNPYMEP